jgi:aldose 1-epimerase
MIELRDGAVRLCLRPEIGGSVALFEAHGEPIFRPAPASSTCVLDMASFPMVPFAGRIEAGRFVWRGKTIQLPGNFPGMSRDRNAIHGQAWLAAWQTEYADQSSAILSYTHEPDAWPWHYRAEQQFVMTRSGFTQRLSITNMGDQAMPAGLGVHPYFPRNSQTVYNGRHHSEWDSHADGIPRTEKRAAHASDWWDGKPVESREVDTTYGARLGDLSITWHDRQMRLTIRPAPALCHTVVFVPAQASYFCVEPVSHVPNAHNAAHPNRSGLLELHPGCTWSVDVSFSLTRSPRC